MFLIATVTFIVLLTSVLVQCVRTYHWGKSRAYVTVELEELLREDPWT